MRTTQANSPPLAATTIAVPAIANVPQAVASPAKPEPLTCPQCGGSGILRMGEQQFRTCLPCLGQGQLAAMVQQELLFPGGAFRPSVSHAR